MSTLSRRMKASQDGKKRINPIWTRFAGGYRIDMPIVSLIREAGFEVPGFHDMYLPGNPKAFGCNVWGTECSG